MESPVVVTQYNSECLPVGIIYGAPHCKNHFRSKIKITVYTGQNYLDIADDPLVRFISVTRPPVIVQVVLNVGFQFSDVII